MKNRNYWRARFELLEELQSKKSEAYYNELKYQYQEALNDIEKDIMVWYQRFVLNNQASITEVKKLLNSKELSELKWTIQEYIKYRKENAINQKWMKELENASARAHITRLEAIKLQIQNRIEVLYNKEANDVETLMKDIYTEGYYHTAYEIHKGIGMATNLARLDDNLISKVIKKPWTSDGLDFSQRIWGKHRPQLIEELHKQLTQIIIRGSDPQEAINAIAKQFDVSKRQAGNLVMTESAFFAAQSKKDCFNNLEIEQFEVVATLDLKTSKICQELDGEVFDMDIYEVGVTSPPFHNYCRTTTAPYFEDEEEYGTRIARGADGKIYTVPSNMKYEEWYNKYVNKSNDSAYNELAIAIEDDNGRLILKKEYEKQYSDKLQDLYKYYKDNGATFNEHALNRVLGQKKSKKEFTKEDVLDVIKTGKEYIQESDGRKVKFKNNVSVVISDDGQIVSVIQRNKIKTDWREV
ncbi:MAG: minor capsid protein [Paraclostridium sp.]